MSPVSGSTISKEYTPGMLHENRREFPEDRITGQMSVLIVALLEFIEVKYDDGAASPIPAVFL